MPINTRLLHVQSADGRRNTLKCSNGQTFESKLVTLASGAAGGKFLTYEDNAPVVAAQTAYGIEVRPADLHCECRRCC